MSGPPLREHGVRPPNAKPRPLVVPQGQPAQARSATDAAVAVLLERPVIEKLLTHLGRDPRPPSPWLGAPCWGPEGRACEVGQDFAA